MKKSSKKPLNLELYQDYNIDQNYSAYEISFENLDQEEVDNIENEYVTKGYKIFHTEMASNSDGSFNYKIVLAKLEFTF